MNKKVRVQKAFSDVNHGSFTPGQVIDLPRGVDWLEAGLVRYISTGKRKPRKTKSE